MLFVNLAPTDDDQSNYGILNFDKFRYIRKISIWTCFSHADQSNLQSYHLKNILFVMVRLKLDKMLKMTKNLSHLYLVEIYSINMHLQMFPFN